jgi:predicted ATPase
MRIRRIRFDNHPTLGTIELDFTDRQGKTVDTIIIAGENGVGKSLLLNLIFEFSNLRLHPIKRDEKRTFELDFTDSEIAIFRESENFKHFFDKPLKENILNVFVDYNIINSWNQISISAKTSVGSTIKIDGHLFNEPLHRKFLSMIFSDVEINFTPKAIQTVTSKNIDRSDFQSEKSNANLATEITQLLIDVQSVDALEFTEWARQNKGGAVDHDKIDVRIRRFTSAFEYMFPSKKYKRIDNVNDQKKIIFEENGREMDIDKLSSGEKQIVFRGSFLLKDKESSRGAIVLIDEPEISLHPNWQLKVLSFFKKLFTNANGQQTSQLIIATHSPFIIHNSNRNADKVIVLQKDESGKIVVSQEPRFYSWSSEKIIQEAFNVSQILNQGKTIIFVEGETDEKYFTKCLEIFKHEDKNIEFKWIGRINENGNAENTGETALNQARTFFLANMDLLPTKTVLLYDSDTKKQEEVFGNLFIRRMATNEHNSIFRIGVENLLTLPSDFDISTFYKQKIKIDCYGAESTIRELDKQKLCSTICDNLAKEKQNELLSRINNEIERLHSEKQDGR